MWADDKSDSIQADRILHSGPCDPPLRPPAFPMPDGPRARSVTETIRPFRWRIAFTYTLTGLTAGASYTLRLHFADPSSTAAGQRQMEKPAVAPAEQAQHARDKGVTVQAVAGALAVYLLVGLLFASAISFAASVQSGFFANAGHVTNGDRVYYSFTVLTTTGFGDYTTATPVGHALAEPRKRRRVVEVGHGDVGVALDDDRAAGLHRPQPVDRANRVGPVHDEIAGHEGIAEVRLHLDPGDVVEHSSPRP